jgi:hypothetical protein
MKFPAWMNGIAFVGFAVFGSTTLCLQAFVTNSNENGQAQYWFKPGSSFSISPNAINLKKRTIKYYVDASAYSESNKENELEALRAAFDQWENIPGTDLHFEEAGFIEATPEINLFDDTNMIFWAKDSTLVNGEMDDIKGTLGVTFRAFFEDYNLVEADMVFNGVDRPWYTDYASEVVHSAYIEAIALHEIGHLIGLEHSTIGSATMMYQAQLGVNSQLSLSADDMAFVQTHYKAKGALRHTGTIQGTIFRGEEGIHGAAVLLEDLDGNLIRGHVSRKGNQAWEAGYYQIPVVPEGDYLLRVTPLDAANAQQFLIRGSVIDFAGLNDAPTDYLPTETQQVTVTAGDTTRHDVTITTGTPAFRISGIQPRAPDLRLLSIERAPTRLKQGDQQVFVGVYGVDLPSENVEFTIRGTGVTFGLKQYREHIFGNADAWIIEVSVDEDALPGARSFELRQGDQVAYANGFIEIEPKNPDINLDGLNDEFQRTHFTRWTAPDAGPDQDADGDTFTNEQEFQAGSDPKNPSSTPLTVLAPYALLSVEVNAEGAQVQFESNAGLRYQLFSRRDIVGDPWEERGQPVLAQGDITIILDEDAGDDYRFYRIETVP